MLKSILRALITSFLLVVGINTFEVTTRNPFVATMIGHATANFMGGTYVTTTKQGAHIYAMKSIPGIDGAIATQRGDVMMIHHLYVNARDVIMHELVHQEQFRKYGTFGMQFLVAYYMITGTQKYGDELCAYYHNPLEVEAYKVQFGPEWEPGKWCE